MKEQIINEFKGKKVLILGFGREGRSTYNFIKENEIDCIIGIADKKEILDEEIKANKEINLHTGEGYLDAMNEYDIIMKTPGISFKDVDITNVKHKITSQTNLFIKYGKEKVIGITGTKGKSTTSSLIYNILKKEYNSVLVGNIGLPAFEMIDGFSDTNWYIYELSSHQLQYVEHSPKIAVLLNMYEEHLDHYKSYDEYKEAKRNIFKFQDDNDTYVFNLDMKDILNEENVLNQNLIEVTNNEEVTGAQVKYNETHISMNVQGKVCEITLPHDELPLKGIHNMYNIAVASVVAKLLDVSNEDIIEGIMTFKTLPHRLENIGTYNGITYIDDSIATIPQATISAVNSVDNVDTVIIGGMDRGINYKPLISFLATGAVKNVILMYDSGRQIYEKLKSNTLANVIFAEDLEKAVELATQITDKGMTCVMSPSAASYCVFKNFEERGDKFKEYVIRFSSNV